MNEDTGLNNAENETNEDELTLLKQRADMMGITYHPAIGVAKLKEKVAAALNDTKSSEGSDEDEVSKTASPTPELSAADKQRMLHTRLRNEANRLVRVRVTCMNPNKKNWHGEIKSVSNDIIGTVKKFIPFGLEEGYHIPAVLLDLLKSCQYQHFTHIKKPNGQKVAVSKLLPEFAIEVLDPLTPAELDDLKKRQALNHSIE